MECRQRVARAVNRQCAVAGNEWHTKSQNLVKKAGILFEQKAGLSCVVSYPWAGSPAIGARHRRFKQEGEEPGLSNGASK
eukprot:1136456-Pelagomonas_calceolata.AAC.3